MIKKCELCGEEFETNNKIKKFCSNECVQKNKSIFQKLYKNSEEGKRINSEAQKIAQNRPEVKEKQRKERKERANRPEVKEKFQKWSQEFHSKKEIKEATSEWTKKFQRDNPEFLKKFHERTKEYYEKEYPFDEEAKLKRSESAKKMFEKPGYKEKVKESCKKYWSNDDNRIKQSNLQKQIHNSPELIKIHRENAQNLWENIEYAQKVISGGLKYKNFIFPSGKIVKIQGYENIVLNELIKYFEEDDIFIGPKEIHQKIGFIKYEYNGTIHKYYPDIYIKSKNLIIEVKSNWTFEMRKEINLLKQQACINMGLNFKFIIL